MPDMIADTRGPIDYDETGEGPTVVLVPGSCSTGAAWRPIIAHLRDGFRCVTTSLLGYGGTAERRSRNDAKIADEADIVEDVIRHSGGPVHLVGHSFGGLSALAVAMRHPELLRSLTILEAPAAEVLRETGEEQLYGEFRTMTGAYFSAYEAGEPSAIERMIDFYGGAGTFQSWPQRVRDYAVTTTPANLLDWTCAFGFALTPPLLADVTARTLVAWGPSSHPAAKRANQLLGQHIPKAAVAEIPGAAHFMIATHPKQVADMIAQHIVRSDHTGRSTELLLE
jgi:pimeloyl-ACP methyl ester carboxylesterase